MRRTVKAKFEAGEVEPASIEEAIHGMMDEIKEEAVEHGETQIEGLWVSLDRPDVKRLAGLERDNFPKAETISKGMRQPLKYPHTDDDRKVEYDCVLPDTLWKNQDGHHYALSFSCTLFDNGNLMCTLHPHFVSRWMLSNPKTVEFCNVKEPPLGFDQFHTATKDAGRVTK